MASYDASINVRVTGTGMVDGVLNRVQELERLVKEINTKPLNLSKIAGRGELADRFGAAAKELNSLKQSFINSEKAVEAFGTTSNRTIANTTALASAFKRIAENSDVATNQFREFTVAAQQAAVAANTLGRNRLDVLRQEISFGGKEGKTIGGGLVAELLAQERQVPKSIAALEAYQAELNDLLKLVDLASPEFQQLAEAIARVDKLLGNQPEVKTARGPTSPIRGREDIPGSPKALEAAAAKRNKLFENLALGAGFPLLFGGGPGQVLGGLLGSFVGTGFGGQILGSAIFGQLEQLGVAANQAGTALQKPIDNFNVIKDRALLASSSQDKYVERLIESGQFIEATTAIQRRYNEVVGRQGSDNLLELTKASDRLNRAWSELNLQIQAALAGPLAGLIEWVANIVRAGADANKEAMRQEEIFKGLSPERQKEFKRREQEILKGANIFNEAAKRRQVAAMATEFAQPQAAAQSNGFRATETIQLASLERQATIQSQLTKLTDTRLQLSSKQLQTDISVLNKQQELTTSLNQQTAIINEIAQVKNAAAQTELALTQSQQRLAVQNAQLDLKRAEAKATAAAIEMRQLDAAGKLTDERRAELQAVMEQAVVARQNLSTTEQIAYYTNKSAASQAEAAQYMADIERRQAIVNAYAEDYARINAETTRKIEEQTNAINNRATLLNAISQATQTLNNIEIQGLERELERVTTAKEREVIINRIYKLEVENARVQREATRANIQAELARADAAYRTVQLKYEELKAVVLIAQAEGVVTRAHFDALRAQESALRIAKDNLNTAGQVANWQWKAADAVFKAAVDAAKLKKETTGAAQAAGQFAGNMERAAGAISSVSGVLGKTTQGAPFAAFGGAMDIQNEGLRKKALDIWAAAEARASNLSRAGDVFAGNAELEKARREILAIQRLEQELAGKQTEKRAEQELQNFADALSAANMAIPYFLSRTLGISPSAAKVAATTSAPSAAPASAPIPLTAPLATGLSRQPGGGPGTAIIDSFPSTINLQTGPVIQQDNGEKYVSLKDLEQILQDFAATIFENSRTSGGRRYQGVS